MAKKQQAEHITGNRRGGSAAPETEHREGTKTMAAHKIWDSMFDKQGDHMSRSEAIQAAVANAGMTQASAATLYQQWRDEHGLVDHNNPGGAAANAQRAAHSGGARGAKAGRTS